MVDSVNCPDFLDDLVKKTVDQLQGIEFLRGMNLWNSRVFEPSQHRHLIIVEFARKKYAIAEIRHR